MALSPGWIAGIVIGSALIVLAVVIGFLAYFRDTNSTAATAGGGSGLPDVPTATATGSSNLVLLLNEETNELEWVDKNELYGSGTTGQVLTRTDQSTNEFENPANYTYQEVSADTTLTETNRIVGVVTTSTAITVTLPEIGANKFGFTIADKTGQAATNNITVATSGSDTVGGASTFVLNGNYNSINLIAAPNEGVWVLA